MTKKKPHKHHKLIIEWALGAQIQMYLPIIKKWVDTDSPPWDSNSARLRIRPDGVSKNSLTAEEFHKQYTAEVNPGAIFGLIGWEMTKSTNKEEDLVLDEDEKTLIKSLRKSPPYDVFPQKPNITYVDGDDELQSNYSPIAFTVSGENNAKVANSIRIALTNMAKKFWYRKKYE